MNSLLTRNFYVALAYEKYRFEAVSPECHLVEIAQGIEGFRSDPYYIEISSRSFIKDEATLLEYSIDIDGQENPDDDSPWESFNTLEEHSPLAKLLNSIEVTGNGLDGCERHEIVSFCGYLSLELDESLMSIESSEDLVNLIEQIELVKPESEIEVVAKQAILFTYTKLLEEL